MSNKSEELQQEQAELNKDTTFTGFSRLLRELVLISRGRAAVASPEQPPVLINQVR